MRLSDFTVEQKVETGIYYGAAGIPNGDFLLGTNPNTVPRVASIDKFRRSDLVKTASKTFAFDYVQAGVSEPQGVYSYFSFYPSSLWSLGVGSDGVLIKIRNSDLSEVSRITLSTQDDTHDIRYFVAAVDPRGEFAYFADGFRPNLVKVRLRNPDGSENFAKVGSLALPASEYRFRSIVIDPSGQYLYLGTSPISSSGQIVKIRLDTFTRVGSLTLNTGEFEVGGAAIDPSGEFGYFGVSGYDLYAGQRNSGKLIKVRLSDFVRVGEVKLNIGEHSLSTGVTDATGSHAYFPTGNPSTVAGLIKFKVK